MPVSYCSGCHRTFSSTSAFELHRVGDFTRKQRRCLVPQQMSVKGMMRNEKGQWTLPPTEEIAPWYRPPQKIAFTSDK
jgi:hypothetical protein